MKNICLAFIPGEKQSFKIVRTTAEVGNEREIKDGNGRTIKMTILASEPCTELGYKFAIAIFQNRIKRSRKTNDTFNDRLRATMLLIHEIGKRTPQEQDNLYKAYQTHLVRNETKHVTRELKNALKILSLS